MSVEKKPILDLEIFIDGIKTLGSKLKNSVEAIKRKSARVLPKAEKEKFVIHLNGSEEDDQIIEDFMR